LETDDDCRDAGEKGKADDQPLSPHQDHEEVEKIDFVVVVIRGLTLIPLRGFRFILVFFCLNIVFHVTTRVAGWWLLVASFQKKLISRPLPFDRLRVARVTEQEEGFLVLKPIRFPSLPFSVTL
jgi:hypothetical protein